MKILLVSTFDTKGGASRATYRLHQGLLQQNINSRILVQEKLSNDTTVIAPHTKLQEGIARAKITFDNFPLKLYPKRDTNIFSVQWLPDRILSQVIKFNPDVINLHWVSGGYMQIETLAKLKRPIIWTLQDMWAFTGGCHYSQNCDHYTQACGACPQLHSQRDWDLSHWIWHRKAHAWKNLNLTIVTPTSWLAKCASSSSLFQNVPVEIIPFGLDTRQYKPID